MRKRVNRAKYSGSVALTTVIVLMALLISLGVALVYSGIDLKRSSKGFYSRENARLTGRSCLEESIYKLKYNTSYVGTINLTIGSGSCNSQISNQGGNPTLKLVQYQGVEGEYSFRESKLVDVSTYPFTISDL